MTKRFLITAEQSFSMMFIFEELTKISDILDSRYKDNLGKGYLDLLEKARKEMCD